jgi:recombination protein RecR
MAELTESVNTLIKELSRLPGIGKKSAERIAYHLLKVSKDEALALADAIRSVKENVRYCKQCYNLSEQELCEICRDARRDTSTICVVEQPRDLIALETTGAYNGLYHVLLGRLSPLDGVGVEQLTIAALIKRIKSGAVKELIMGTNPTVEGDGTALYIMSQLEGSPVRITRLARGITTGSVLEFANKEMLSDALSGRQSFR